MAMKRIGYTLEGKERVDKLVSNLRARADKLEDISFRIDIGLYGIIRGIKLYEIDKGDILEMMGRS